VFNVKHRLTYFAIRLANKIETINATSKLIVISSVNKFLIYPNNLNITVSNAKLIESNTAKSTASGSNVS
jgi:hypothetical protein